MFQNYSKKISLFLVSSLILVGINSFAATDQGGRTITGEFKECKECAKISAERRTRDSEPYSGTSSSSQGGMKAHGADVKEDSQ